MKTGHLLQENCPTNFQNLSGTSGPFICTNLNILGTLFIGIPNTIQISSSPASINIDGCKFYSCPNTILAELTENSLRKEYVISKSCFTSCSSGSFVVRISQGDLSTDIETFKFEGSSVITTDSSRLLQTCDIEPAIQSVNMSGCDMGYILGFEFTNPKDFSNNYLIKYLQFGYNSFSTQCILFEFSNSQPPPSNLITNSNFIQNCCTALPTSQLLIVESRSIYIISIISDLTSVSQITIDNSYFSFSCGNYAVGVICTSTGSLNLYLNCSFDQTPKHIYSNAKIIENTIDIGPIQIGQISCGPKITDAHNIMYFYNYAVILVCGLLLYPIYNEEIPLTSYSKSALTGQTFNGYN